MDLQTEDLGNSTVYRPKDQSKLMNRLILKIESNFPTLFYWLKKKVIKFLIGNSWSQNIKKLTTFWSLEVLAI